MKRTRNGILMQGSIDLSNLPTDFNAPAFASHFLDQLSAALNLEIQRPTDIRQFFDSDQIHKLRQLYQSRAWLAKR